LKVSGRKMRSMMVLALPEVRAFASLAGSTQEI
jgi:hypothetical protein